MNARKRGPSTPFSFAPFAASRAALSAPLRGKGLARRVAENPEHARCHRTNNTHGCHPGTRCRDPIHFTAPGDANAPPGMSPGMTLRKRHGQALPETPAPTPSLRAPRLVAPKQIWLRRRKRSNPGAANSEHAAPGLLRRASALLAMTFIYFRHGPLQAGHPRLSTPRLRVRFPSSLRSLREKSLARRVVENPEHASCHHTNQTHKCHPGEGRDPLVPSARAMKLCGRAEPMLLINFECHPASGFLLERI